MDKRQLTYRERFAALEVTCNRYNIKTIKAHDNARGNPIEQILMIYHNLFYKESKCLKHVHVIVTNGVYFFCGVVGIVDTPSAKARALYVTGHLQCRSRWLFSVV